MDGERTVASYLEFNPNADRMHLLIGIVEGLVYLHTRKPAIIHGDLRAGNALVSDEGVPCLTDFGLSRIVDEEVRGMTTSSELAGSVRWMAPELFQGEGTVSRQSDVWAIGMTTLEILSERIPYYTVKSDLIVLSQVREGRTPSRPSDPRAFELLDDSMWDICQRCWALEPAARPSMEEVFLMMTWVYAPVFLPL